MDNLYCTEKYWIYTKQKDVILTISIIAATAFVILAEFAFLENGVLSVVFFVLSCLALIILWTSGIVYRSLNQGNAEREKTDEHFWKERKKLQDQYTKKEKER